MTRKDRFRPPVLVFLSALVLLSVPSGSLVAQRPSPIDLTALDPPPPTIARLINDSKVTFQSGGGSGSRQVGFGPGLAAKTEYKISFQYNSRSRWRVSADHSTLIINVRYFDIEWTPQHQVWFRLHPPRASFWTDRLVLHELDHVRISSDPRFRKQFQERLAASQVIRRSVSSSNTVNQSFVDRLVDRNASDIFESISQLVAIRYKELDRVTNHGLRPVPSDSELNEFLRPSSVAAE